jgi:hypothetical protein
LLALRGHWLVEEKNILKRSKVLVMEQLITLLVTGVQEKKVSIHLGFCAREEKLENDQNRQRRKAPMLIKPGGDS